MKLLRLALVGCLVLGLTAVAQAEEKKAEPSKDQLVGRWRATKSEGLPPGAIVQFMKNGRLKVSAKVEGKDLALEGTWSLEGDKLTVNLKQGDREHKETLTVKTLTANKLVTVDEKGKSDEFTKAK